MPMNRSEIDALMRSIFLFALWLSSVLVCGCDLVHGADRMTATTYFSGPEAKLEAAIYADEVAAISLAVATGANVNARGINNVTPLMIAVDRLKRKAVAELLSRGVAPNLKSNDGASAVSLAVENYRDAPEIMFAVFKGGGDPNTRRPDNDPVIKRFMNDRNCEFLQHMKNLGADLNIVTRGGDPIIAVAGVVDDWDIVWCLIELGAKYDYEQTSRSPLSASLASALLSPDSPIFPYKKKVWKFLKDHGIAVQPLKEQVSDSSAPHL